MSQQLKTSLSRTIFKLCLMLPLTSCGVLFPDQDRPPIVLTKTEMVERPLLLETQCPPKPTPPPKPQGHNTLSADAAEYFANLDGWAMACRDINQAIESLLRPSKEALRPSQ